MKPVTVAELIEFLQKQPQNIAVAFRQYSDCSLLELDDIMIVEMGEVRPDGWIQNNFRKDLPIRPYLLFPGN